jgi:hypothetical protein
MRPILLGLLPIACLGLLVPIPFFAADPPVKREIGSAKSEVVGAWHDVFDEDAFVIFFANGKALFSFTKPPEKPISEWHQTATWKEIKTGRIEVTFVRTGTASEGEKEIYVLHDRLKDVLVSPHGSSLRRVGGSADK